MLRNLAMITYVLSGVAEGCEVVPELYGVLDERAQPLRELLPLPLTS